MFLKLICSHSNRFRCTPDVRLMIVRRGYCQFAAQKELTPPRSPDPPRSSVSSRNRSVMSVGQLELLSGSISRKFLPDESNKCAPAVADQ